jgi:F-type H+-transporting ATPase subunit delta
MKAASRGSAATSRERLDAVVANVDAARLAEELRGVARLFVREPALRRAFVDPARSAEARVELLEGVLGSQVSSDTLDILRTVVSGRWSRATDLLNTIEVLSVEAELAAAEKANALADVEDELFRFSRVVGGDPQLASALSDPAADVERKVTLARDLLSAKATAFTVRLVELAISGLGGRNFDASLQRLVELTADRRDRQVAYVRVAAPLTDEQEERLSARLSGLYGRQISLKVTVDPKIIGGATVQVGDDLYDGSVARRLDQARTALTK